MKRPLNNDSHLSEISKTKPDEGNTKNKTSNENASHRGTLETKVVITSSFNNQSEEDQGLTKLNKLIEQYTVNTEW